MITIIIIIIIIIIINYYYLFDKYVKASNLWQNYPSELKNLNTNTFNKDNIFYYLNKKVLFNNNQYSFLFSLFVV